MPEDILHTIRGIGGSEVVFSRRVDYLRVGGRALPGFEVEIGGLDYGFEINGILGMDFLTRAAAVLDLGNLTIEFPGAGTLRCDGARGPPLLGLGENTLLVTDV
jgi:hypothetical protein